MVSVKGRVAGSPRVVVVGGGLSGIAVAARLKMGGFETFDVFEQSDGPGGTWHDARYPGAAVDTPQPMYSYSFTKTHSFSRVYAEQPELLAYLENTIDELELRPHFHFNVTVTGAEWSEHEAEYTVSLSTGERRRYQVLVSAVGFLNNPRYPDWPHLSEFTGTVFHSSRWEPVDTTGKRVALIGTGSGGAQIAGAIAPQVAELLVFQREPGWVLPKPDTVFTAEDRDQLAAPKRRRNLRRRQYVEREFGGVGANVGADPRGGLLGMVTAVRRHKNVLPKDLAEQYIAEIFADRPDLREMVTPKYVFGGKRVIKDSTYYPALVRDNVRLIPRAVNDAYSQGVIDVDAQKYEVDIIVLATGYQASNYLATLPVRGRNGRLLSEVWNGEPSAFMGMTVPGFPNFFMMYGPNTNSVFLVNLFECEAAYVLRCVRRLARGVKSIEVKEAWHDGYNRWIDKRVEKSAAAKAVMAGVHTYYATESGRIVGYMPMKNVTYGVLLRLLGKISTSTSKLVEPESRLG
jgi:cation diffusion facilitator CzcD-associated flavoprotein CzcO